MIQGDISGAMALEPLTLEVSKQTIPPLDRDGHGKMCPWLAEDI